MNIKVLPRFSGGNIEAISSKSHAHRALICAALADGTSLLRLNSSSEDIRATCRCLEALGCHITHNGSELIIEPGPCPASPVLDCGESGSTLRFLLPVAAALGCGAAFTGRGRLPQRPLEPLLSELKKHGVIFDRDTLPFTLSGRLEGGSFALPGNISSQYITGLMLALPLAGGGSVHLTTPLESKGYVDLTVSTVEQFGVTISPSDDGFCIPSGEYKSRSISIDGDWSNSAFWLCAGALAAPVTVHGLDMSSLQGDKAVIRILAQMGAGVRVQDNCVTISPGELCAVEIDAGDIPDLIPVLAVTAAFCRGETRIYNAGRLRLKESDRLEAVAEQINSLGGSAVINGDELLISGGGLTGGRVSSNNDHRMVMSAAVAALRCPDGVDIEGCEAVNKSYPDFFKHLKTLGGDVIV